MGRMLKIFGVVFLVLVVLIAGAGFYFYNYYVFKTVRVCVGEGADSGTFCNLSSDCIDFIREQGIDINLSGVPDFVDEIFQKIVNKAVYCNDTCFVGNVRGLSSDMQKLGTIDSCENNEVEFVIDIRGKEGIEIFRYLRQRNEIV
ncbi:MAG: hypothetical protein V1889_03850 [archaeon]